MNLTVNPDQQGPASAEQLEGQAMAMFKEGGAMAARPTTQAAPVKVQLGTSFHRISLDRSRITIVTPSGEQVAPQNGALYGVLVAASPIPARTMFRPGQFDSDNPTAPICVSADGNVPHPNSPQPQAQNCRDCPNNQKGSGGLEGTKACKTIHPMVFAAAQPKQEGGWQLTPTPILLRTNASSIFGQSSRYGMPLKQYNSLLEQNGVLLSEVITRLQIDVDAKYPSTLAFFNQDWADDSVQAQIAGMLEQHQGVIDQMLDVTTSLSDGGDVVGQEPAAQSAASPAAAPAQAAQPAAAPEPAQAPAPAAVATQPAVASAPEPAPAPQPAPAAAPAPAQAAPAQADIPVAQAEAPPMTAADMSAPAATAALAPAAPQVPTDGVAPAPTPAESVGGASASDFNL